MKGKQAVCPDGRYLADVRKGKIVKMWHYDATITVTTGNGAHTTWTWSGNETKKRRTKK